SGFGLMEMSRQRLRPGMIEATTQPCPHCHGTGLIRSDDSMALSVLRQIEEEGTRRRSREVLVKCPVGISNFLINQKRDHIAQIEGRYGMAVRIEADPQLVSPDFSLEKFKTATRVINAVEAPVVSVDTSIMDQIDEDEETTPEAAPEALNGEEGEGKPKRRRRRRRSRGRGKSNNGADTGDHGENAEAATDPAPVAEKAPVEDATATEEVAEEAPKKKPTRTRRSRAKAADPVIEERAPEDAVTEGEAPAEAEAASEKPKKTRTRRPAKKVAEPAPTTEVPQAAAEATAEPEPVAAEPDKVPEPVAESAAVPDEPSKPKRRGWWSLSK
ncbi:MAG: ribonuclease E/G, partial [Pseudomonadota bacterium]